MSWSRPAAGLKILVLICLCVRVGVAVICQISHKYLIQGYNEDQIHLIFHLIIKKPTIVHYLKKVP